MPRLIDFGFAICLGSALGLAGCSGDESKMAMGLADRDPPSLRILSIGPAPDSLPGKVDLVLRAEDPFGEVRLDFKLPLFNVDGYDQPYYDFDSLPLGDGSMRYRFDFRRFGGTKSISISALDASDNKATAVAIGHSRSECACTQIGGGNNDGGDFAESPTGEIYVNCQFILRLDTLSGRFLPAPIPPTTDYPQGIGFDHQGRLWIGFGLSPSSSARTDSLRVYQGEKLIRTLPTPPVLLRRMAFDSHDRLWSGYWNFSGEGGVAVLQDTGWQFFPLPAGYIITSPGRGEVLVDTRDVAWARIGGSIYAYENGTWTNKTPLNTVARKLTLDRDGVLHIMGTARSLAYHSEAWVEDFAHPGTDSTWGCASTDQGNGWCISDGPNGSDSVFGYRAGLVASRFRSFGDPKEVWVDSRSRLWVFEYSSICGYAPAPW